MQQVYVVKLQVAGDVEARYDVFFEIEDAAGFVQTWQEFTGVDIALSRNRDPDIIYSVQELPKGLRMLATLECDTEPFAWADIHKAFLHQKGETL